MTEQKTDAAHRNTVEQLVGDLGICAEIEDVTVTSERLAGNDAKADWHKGKGAGLRQAQAMLRDVLANIPICVQTKGGGNETVRSMRTQ